VDAEDFFAALHVGARHDYAAVKSARTEQRRVENIGAVGGGYQDHAFVGFETVHLDE
jgi:hypothetical protein